MYLILFGQLNISLWVAPIQLMHQDESITFILKQGAIEFLIYSSLKATDLKTKPTNL